MVKVVAPVYAANVGAVVSMLIGPTFAVAELPATSVAVPVTYWAAPSVPTVLSAGQERIAVSASEQVKCTTTDPLYQPLTFGELVGAPVIAGGTLSTFSVRLCAGAVLSSTLPA